MSKLVSMSEAASIAIHGIIIIARASEPLNVQAISDLTGTSRHHVAKIMQRLVKEGYINSQRGPAGGFRLLMKAEEISFLQLYESIEGKIEVPSCTMDKKTCPFDKCIMDNISSRMTIEFREYLRKQIVADYTK